MCAAAATVARYHARGDCVSLSIRRRRTSEAVCILVLFFRLPYPSGRRFG